MYSGTYIIKGKIADPFLREPYIIQYVMTYIMQYNSAVQPTFVIVQPGIYIDLKSIILLNISTLSHFCHS